ncbi:MULTISPECIES: replication-associated recombination protein A [Veillonella]|jgi:putative ATPase|uniref:Replication-associated recombination protein RarA n=1 Tax=Veillonella rogosae JCM 15642 TaxID=1298595 RepID=A0ABX5BVM5_9FIRM|nr:MULTISPECIES: replication-associated recombination protein A [Veillonella]MBF1767221.1 replication-associated recombination protein A [Veillonella sp.]MBS6449749.1 replication-associated recombination protein A [Veillonella sp. oral taxon 158]MDU1973620.1 replication-associated recombination protein A [Veillonella sp.]MDU3563554.1 replication-associated recombination protein A [Veillonella sp.]MDU3630966.1 replication-associated recombination protein A [Veillonella sp.]
MDSLFDLTPTNTYEPLPVRMRPTKLDHLYGQEKAVGKGTFLRAMVEKDTIPSMLFYGPCGTGKTTLAGIIAKMSNSHFVNLNATNAGIGELRTIIEDARKRVRSLQQRTILFLDEIHRFNKSQQDVLLPCVEDGTIILIGATTENPFFEVNRPLLSRLRLITLEALTPKAIGQILRRAITDEEVGLGKRRLQVTDEVLEDVGIFVNGDGRMALNILEQAAAMVPDEGTISIEVLEKVVGRRIYTYDKKGDSHYDTISAFIKSMRGSDVQATVHYLARMIEAGEDPNFIARRIVICAAEDVGLADPQALILANAAAQAAHMVGFPEARIILSEAACYVALAPKSNSAYMAIDAAIADVRHKDCGQVPDHLKDSHYSGASKLGHGKAYKYAHNYPNGYVKQQYLPTPLVDATYYNGIKRGREEQLLNDWEERRKS